MHYGVIMAGGSGTRLWPLSRSDKPKQLLPLVRGKSLLQLSYERLLGVVDPKNIYVCTGASYAEQVLACLPDLPRENLLGEPQGRDTANAVGFSAAVLHKKDPDAIACVVTADHVIEPIEQFQKSLRTAFSVAEERPRSLVTFGIVPTHGHTGLGYIHRGTALPLKSGETSAFQVQAFREKPDKVTADQYVDSGRYYWNSGMFVWRCDTVLDELSAFLPENRRMLDQIAAAWGTPSQQQVLNDLYPQLRKISVDYAVMEPASQGKGNSQVVVVEMPVQWLDVGSWPALADTLATDDRNNATDAQTAVFVDSDDNIVISSDPEHLVSLVGVSDMIVVHTRDATLVCQKTEAQRVKDLVQKIREKYGDRYN
jgi:mannose-1-phosphate guanylyltransferase